MDPRRIDRKRGAMDAFLDLTKRLNDYGLWSALSVAVQLGIFWIGLVVIGRRRRIPNLNFTFALVEGEFKDRTRSNRQLQILVRNLSGTDVLLGAASFTTRDRSAISEYADGDSAASEYELKFRTKEDDFFSDAFTLIKSTHHAVTWVPLNEEMEPAKIIEAIHGRRLRRSWFRCKIIVLTKRPDVIHCRIPVINVQHRKYGLYVDAARLRAAANPMPEVIARGEPAPVAPVTAAPAVPTAQG